MSTRIAIKDRVAAILGDHEDLAHPYDAKFRVSDAITIVLNVLSLSFSEARCQNLQDVLTGIRDAHPGHTWITGAYATQVVKMTLAKRAGYDAAAKKRPCNPSVDPAYRNLLGKGGADEPESSHTSLARVWKEGYEKFGNEVPA